MPRRDILRQKRNNERRSKRVEEHGKSRRRGRMMRKERRGGKKEGCKDRVIKEEGRTDGKKRTKEECPLAGALCCLWVLSSK